MCRRARTADIGLPLTRQTRTPLRVRPVTWASKAPGPWSGVMASGRKLIKGPDHGRAFLQIMRSTERTAAKQARYRAAVRDVPYPVQAVWAADDPTMTLAVYGEKARAAAALRRVHTVPGKHFPQEDQAPAITRQIAELALRG